jgi:hypothetical protein
MRKCMTLLVLSALLCSVLPLKAQENFTEQEVSFTVGEDTLYATLTLPAGAPKFPAACCSQAADRLTATATRR